MSTQEELKTAAKHQLRKFVAMLLQSRLPRDEVVAMLTDTAENLPDNAEIMKFMAEGVKLEHFGELMRRLRSDDIVDADDIDFGEESKR